MESANQPPMGLVPYLRSIQPAAEYMLSKCWLFVAVSIVLFGWAIIATILVTSKLLGEAFDLICRVGDRLQARLNAAMKRMREE